MNRPSRKNCLPVIAGAIFLITAVSIVVSSWVSGLHIYDLSLSFSRYVGLRQSTAVLYFLSAVIMLVLLTVYIAKTRIDTRPGVSYPDLAEGEKERLYIIHDRERDNRAHLNRETWHSEAAKEILLFSVTEEEILRGKIGEGSFIARVISKARIDDVEI